ncbi:MAG: CopG family transcriptional regulator [Thermoprotei archaeon]|nr:MAG: CopG family transcriptional regulator [Thermoprotei archaeon]
MVKVKTSIYVDKEIWEMFKKYAVRKGVEISSLLEEIMRDEIIDLFLDKALLEAAGSEDYVLDFEPVKAKGVVSELVRVMRDERANRLSRQ